MCLWLFVSNRDQKFALAIEAFIACEAAIEAFSSTVCGSLKHSGKIFKTEICYKM